MIALADRAVDLVCEQYVGEQRPLTKFELA